MKDQFCDISGSKRKNKTEKSGIPTKRSRVNENYDPPKGILFDDLGGIDECIDEILEYIVMPLMHPEVYSYIGIQLPRFVAYFLEKIDFFEEEFCSMALQGVERPCLRMQ